jgi:sulfur carrier protein ThiS
VVIEIQLVAYLRHYLPKGAKGLSSSLQVPDRSSVEDVLKHLKVPDDVAERVMMILVNGTNATRERVLSDGDVLTVVPMVAGG